VYQNFRQIMALLACVTVVATLTCDAGEGDMANPTVFIAGYNPTVSAFTLDMNSGALTPLATSDGGKNPTYMSIHPNKKFLYAINETDGGTVVAFSINPKDGALTKINEASGGGKGPCHVLVHPSGKWLFTGNYGSGHVGVLPIKSDGSVDAPVQSLQPGKNAHQVICDSTGKFVFVPLLGSDIIAQFVFDEATGQLKPNDPPSAALPTKAGPRHIVIHPSNKFAYVINELGSTVTSFKYDAAKGLLSDPETLPTVPEGTDLKGKSTAHVMTSPDGKFLYGSNRGFDTIVIYSINADTGRLTLVGQENGGGDVKVPRDFNIDPTGKFVIVANQNGESVTVFRRDAAKGTLEKLSTVKTQPKPCYVGFMPK